MARARARKARRPAEGLAQTLTALKLRLQALAAGEERPASKSALGEALALVARALEEVRRLELEPYPAMLEDVGIVATLQRYCERVAEETALRVTVREAGQRRQLPPRVAGGLFRAVTQLVATAHEHWRAREGLVSIHWRRRGVRVVVLDDGGGSSVAGPRPGVGLAGLHERIAALGGELVVESHAKAGTRVIVDVPLRG